jgi:hypothetical protein
MSTITIPGEVLQFVRDELYNQLGGFGEDIASESRVPGSEIPGDWLRCVARFDRTRALLDRIGWTTREPERDVTIELTMHRRALTDALGDELAYQRRTVEEEGHSHEGAAAVARQEEAHRHVLLIEAFAGGLGLDVDSEPVERPITIPASFRHLLTEALLGALHSAAEGVEDAGLDPERFPEPLARFDAIRAALWVTQWGEISTIDADAHGYALQVALAERLEAERGFIADGASHREPLQVRRASTYAEEIEAFMRAAGLSIPDTFDAEEDR